MGEMTTGTELTSKTAGLKLTEDNRLDIKTLTEYDAQAFSREKHTDAQNQKWADWSLSVADTALGATAKLYGMYWQGKVGIKQAEADITESNNRKEIANAKSNAYREVEMRRADVMAKVKEYEAEVRKHEVDGQVKIEKIRGNTAVALKAVEEREKSVRMASVAAQQAWKREDYIV